MVTPLLSPEIDMVCAWAIRSIDPPTHRPVGSELSPLDGGVTRHSSGWMLVQW